MANEQNLRPVKSKEEARERGRKGGIASGKVRAAKKTFQELAKIVLNLKVKNPKEIKKLQELGITDEDMNYKMLCVLGIAKKALKDGDVKAFEKLQELAGELQDEEKKNNGILEELTEFLKNDKIDE